MTRDDGYTRYTMRIPTPLYERVKDAAGEASVNSLIVQVLEDKYPAPATDFTVEELLAHIKRLRQFAGDDPKMLAEIDLLERGALAALLSALGLDVSHLGFHEVEENEPHLDQPD